MKNNKMGNKLFLLAMLGMVLALGLGLMGCKTDADDDDPPGGGSKPTVLAIDATHAQAMAKLDEIIAYSGTPAAVKTSAQSTKTAYEGATISSNWSAYRATVVATVNALIGQIP